MRLFDPEELGGDGCSAIESEVTRRWGVRGGSRRGWWAGDWGNCGSSDCDICSVLSRRKVAL